MSAHFDGGEEITGRRLREVEVTFVDDPTLDFGAEDSDDCPASPPPTYYLRVREEEKRRSSSSGTGTGSAGGGGGVEGGVAAADNSSGSGSDKCCDSSDDGDGQQVGVMDFVINMYRYECSSTNSVTDNSNARGRCLLLYDIISYESSSAWWYYDTHSHGYDPSTRTAVRVQSIYLRLCQHRQAALTTHTAVILPRRYDYFAVVHTRAAVFVKQS